MTTQQVTSPEPGKKIELRKMQILTLGDIKIVPQQISASGIIDAVGMKPEEQTTGLSAFIFHLISGKKSETVYLWDREGEKAASSSCELDGNTVELSYGSKATALPFSIKLNKFIL